MRGEILGFDADLNVGTIIGENEQRYNFEKNSFKENVALKKELKVDFYLNGAGEAIDIYTIRDINQENRGIIFGLVAIVLTLFLGFIGTFISRVALAKQPAEVVIVPTLLHLVLLFVLIIPFIGWLIYVGGTLYYMYKNYLLATTPQA
jgi:hypothetical protein